MILSIITAMDNNRLIGKENGLPWRLPADLQFFKKVTMGKPILMGRKTYESIGKPLPGRQNIIITHEKAYQADGCDVVHSIEDAIKIAGNADEVMVIGGASFYEQMLPKADRLYLTQIDAECDGDAWFPDVDFSKWKEIDREDHQPNEKNAYRYSFITYERIR